MTTDPLQEWLTTVERELGLHRSEGDDHGLDAVHQVADLVSDKVDASVAARTAFLIGAAAGRAEEPPIAAHDFTEKIAALARSWNADTERAAQPNDPANRASHTAGPGDGSR
ncbi:DUF6457 domain-containing protein [Pseudonocardia sp. KRD291]|uniref:DUF6457 domain-containing protein n=1 Tax=Pseudonocardia sp. KRD291 TaxID=2792007 RepID=UPI001C4A1930|nr:DUF6457 domain-containing protein [Pseudonocardia sp. KRD291]MBW0101338.1 hypothetical protein [Pseudonocardia sp. KRD291]